MSTATAPVANLAVFDDDFQTAKKTFGGGTLDLKDLKDGEYEFTIKQMEITDTKNGPLVKLQYELLSEGQHAGGIVEWTYWLLKKNKETGLMEKNINQLAALKEDLEKLGFDPKKWTKFSEQIVKVPLVATGLRFKANKKQGGEKDNGGHYQNLNIVGRAGTDGKPEKLTDEWIEDQIRDPFGDK